jgi:SM-20-related protein
MPTADFFTQFGFLIFRGFFSEELCSSLCSEINDGYIDCTPDIVRNGVLVLDETARKTDIVKISATSESLVQTRMLELMPKLSDHFVEPLTECSTLRFLRYNEGHFFGLHRDSGPYDGPPKNEWDRKISATIFLNEESNDPGQTAFEGGNLVFYVLGSTGVPLKAETGLLVAFRADIVHEVKPIIRGKRYSIVGRFR